MLTRLAARYVTVVAGTGVSVARTMRDPALPWQTLVADVGTARAVDDNSAKSFTESFYEALVCQPPQRATR